MTFEKFTDAVRWIVQWITETLPGKLSDIEGYVAAAEDARDKARDYAVGEEEIADGEFSAKYHAIEAASWADEAQDWAEGETDSAKHYAETAKDWAVKDTAVEGGNFSAKWYADAAEGALGHLQGALTVATQDVISTVSGYATSAGNNATAAQIQAEEAKRQADEAKQSALDAATSSYSAHMAQTGSEKAAQAAAFYAQSVEFYPAIGAGVTEEGYQYYSMQVANGTQFLQVFGSNTGNYTITLPSGLNPDTMGIGISGAGNISAVSGDTVTVQGTGKSYFTIYGTSSANIWLSDNLWAEPDLWAI
jgi:hypothetical protein